MESRSPQRLVSLQHVNELKGISFRGESGLRLGAGVTLEELIENAEVREHYPALVQAAEGRSQPANPQHGNRGRRPLPAPALLVLSRRVWIAGGLQGQAAGPRWRQPLPRHPGKFRTGLFRQPLQPGAHPDCIGRQGEDSMARKARANFPCKSSL